MCGSRSLLVLSFIVSVAACSSAVATTTPDPVVDLADSGTITAQGKNAIEPDASAKDASADASTKSSPDAGDDADAADDASPPPPPTPAIRFVGRFDTSDAAGPVVGWPGARIIARFDGTSANVTLNDTTAGKGSSYWDVTVDDVLQTPPLALAAGTSTYALASGLAPGVHTIELYKRTEGQVAKTQFLGFDFGAAGQLLAPPPGPNRNIEFIVDSGAIGYGILGTVPTCPFSAATENAHISYAGLASSDLGADAHLLGFSGKGVFQNYDRTDPTTFKLLFPRTLPMTTNPAWDFTQFAPDVVWLSLGANDWDIPTANAPPPTLASFQTAYRSLVVQVRAAHPNAHIFLGITSSLNDDYPHGYNAYTNVKTALSNVIAQLADPKIYLHDFARANSTVNLTGCGYHPNAAWARTMADEVVAAIKDKTKWM